MKHKTHSGAILAALVFLLAGCEDSSTPLAVLPTPGSCVDYVAFSHWVASWRATDAPLNQIALVGPWAYVTSGRSVYVLDVSTPQAPRLQTTVVLDGPLRKIVAHGARAYAAASLVLVTFDVSDAANPHLLGTELFFDGISDVDGNEAFAYVATGTGLQVVDVRDGRHPQRIAGLTYPRGVSSVAVSGRYAFAAVGYGGDMDVVDISRPDSPVVVAQRHLGVFVSRMALAENRLVTLGFGGLAVIDISMPTAPRVVGKAVTSAPATALAVNGDRVYVTT